MQKLIFSAIAIFSIAFCMAQSNPQSISIIPKPLSTQIKNGNFAISKTTVLHVADEADKKAAEFFNDYLQQFYGFKLSMTQGEGKNRIRIFTKKFIKAPDKDAYTLDINADGVNISGDTYAGSFYGIQTLIQLLPVKVSAAPADKLSIPFVSIQDAPRFTYRGMHLDVARHFFPVAFVKKYIDYLALHKLNYFHWHLTDDQGWRIEIKKYPKLTEIGSCRNGTIIGRYPGSANDNNRYCGFYTQEEIKDVVQYASDRHITVVPEIEMPGHASAAIASYSYLSCFPEEETKIPTFPSEASKNIKGKKVQETWGIFDDVFCAGKDSTFQFWQDVVDEILPLFPSKYIHVGGDECPKNNWKRCPQCQARMKQEGLKDEHELQSYFVQRMEKYINDKGRTIIGWDEILEGGLAPNAIVMSWRGEQGGIAAAQQKHFAIMTPTNFMYFDYAQSLQEDSVTFGSHTPLGEVYSYNPVPKQLNQQQAKYILGGQANLWTEYISNPRKVEYQVFPRISALSEVLWTEPAKKNFSDFENRLQKQLQRYGMWGTNYSNAHFGLDVSITPAPAYKGLQVKLQSRDKAGKITYGIVGRHLQKNYSKPLMLTEDAAITTILTNKGRVTDSTTVNLKINKATGKKITIVNPPLSGYNAEGGFTLVNGIINEMGLARSNEFLGYRGSNMLAKIDLGSIQRIDSVIVHAIIIGGSRVYPPESVEIYQSTDGKNFRSIGKTSDFVSPIYGKGVFTVRLPPTSTRYVQVAVRPLMKIAEGKTGAGEQALMFVDEIEIK